MAEIDIRGSSACRFSSAQSVTRQLNLTDQGGRFHEFLKEGPRSTTAALDRLIETFPSFRDESAYRGARVAFQKRAQLSLWQLHARFGANGYFALEDPERLTIFADYILPVALRRLGMLSCSDALERAINARPPHPER